jgi:NAD(P)-dependent dehydrogenase (short-subunit alcohol dehydrogenase family)
MTTTTATLQDRIVLVVGRGGGIARAVALTARNAGARAVPAHVRIDRRSRSR